MKRFAESSDLNETPIQKSVTRRADALHAEQVAIGEALLALRDGRYGACADCGESIPVERLLAQPTALRCVRCQALTEQTSGAA